MSSPCGLTIKHTLGKVCLSMFLFIVCLTYSRIPSLGKVCLGMFPFIVCLTYSYIPQGIMPRYVTSSKRFMSFFSFLDIYIYLNMISLNMQLFLLCTYFSRQSVINFSSCRIPWFLVSKKVLPPIYCEIFYYILYPILIYIKLE